MPDPLMPRGIAGADVLGEGARDRPALPLRPGDRVLHKRSSRVGQVRATLIQAGVIATARVRFEGVVQLERVPAGELERLITVPLPARPASPLRPTGLGPLIARLLPGGDGSAA